MEERDLNPVGNVGEGNTLGQRRPGSIKALRYQSLRLLEAHLPWRNMNPGKVTGLGS